MLAIDSTGGDIFIYKHTTIATIAIMSTGWKTGDVAWEERLPVWKKSQIIMVEGM